ncbi:hypothetical protein PYCCODRAFT_6229 [Trametes coccinea BRFM310]|uniref:Secreted protein n=1 Tax=Trametes coccinea (strain BRFM310) TaxID=1353009 RepID=A0A1Y2J5V9_TRAC3|nr:hypothetical protein PYCCODRAFT_6229 [Trametes coccinea BRFM310]
MRRNCFVALLLESFFFKLPLHAAYIPSTCVCVLVLRDASDSSSRSFAVVTAQSVHMLPGPLHLVALCVRTGSALACLSCRRSSRVNPSRFSIVSRRA